MRAVLKSRCWFLGMGLLLWACGVPRVASDTETQEVARVITALLESRLSALLLQLQTSPLTSPLCEEETSAGCSRWCSDSSPLWSESCELVGKTKTSCAQKIFDWQSVRTSIESNFGELSRAGGSVGVAGPLSIRIRHHSEVWTVYGESTVPRPRELHCEGRVTVTLAAGAVQSRVLQCKDWMCTFGSESVDCSSLQRELNKITRCD